MSPLMRLDCQTVKACAAAGGMLRGVCLLACSYSGARSSDGRHWQWQQAAPQYCAPPGEAAHASNAAPHLPRLCTAPRAAYWQVARRRLLEQFCYLSQGCSRACTGAGSANSLPARQQQLQGALTPPRPLPAASAAGRGRNLAAAGAPQACGAGAATTVCCRGASG